MTDKELRKLHREDLLQILINQQRQIDELTAAAEESERALAERKIDIEESGSIAEAALKLNGVFTAAQQAADQYAEEARARADRLVKEAEKAAEETRKTADDILRQARIEAERILGEARREGERAKAAEAPAPDGAQPETQEKSRGGLFRRNK